MQKYLPLLVLAIAIVGATWIFIRGWRKHKTKRLPITTLKANDIIIGSSATVIGLVLLIYGDLLLATLIAGFFVWYKGPKAGVFVSLCASLYWASNGQNGKLLLAMLAVKIFWALSEGTTELNSVSSHNE